MNRPCHQRPRRGADARQPPVATEGLPLRRNATGAMRAPSASTRLAKRFPGRAAGPRRRASRSDDYSTLPPCDAGQPVDGRARDGRTRPAWRAGQGVGGSYAAAPEERPFGAALQLVLRYVLSRPRLRGSRSRSPAVAPVRSPCRRALPVNPGTGTSARDGEERSHACGSRRIGRDRWPVRKAGTRPGRRSSVLPGWLGGPRAGGAAPAGPSAREKFPPALGALPSGR